VTSVAGSGSTRDARSHADKDVNFEVESPRSAIRNQARLAQTQAAQRTASRPSDRQFPNPNSRLPDGSESQAGSPQVELVPHVVERRENFWTISRLYYSSGRYYRALWKANAAKFHEIDQLHVGDVILIPPVEDLDPAYIDPPRARPARYEEIDPANERGRSASSSSATARRAASSSTRTNRPSTSDRGDTITVRRSSRTEAVLDLPVTNSASQRLRGNRRADADPATDEGSDDQAEIRLTARPRTSAPSSQSVYMVRADDTLRSIARDTLGTARRAGEILELNRDIIDDPTHLIPGQLLSLPEDARIRRTTRKDW
jgi:nucleoid-associated protein YgaU